MLALPEPSDNVKQSSAAPEVISGGVVFTPVETHRSHWHHPDQFRAWFAIGSIALLFATILLAFFAAIWGTDSDWTHVKDLLTMVLPVEAAIVGGAVSFYFASRPN